LSAVSPAMSQQLVICLIAVVVNLVGMLVLYSAASYFLTRRAWRGRGMGAVIVLVIATQLLWLPTAFAVTANDEALRAASYSLWFGNWLVTGFALVLLQRRAANIPRSLDDAAQVDGLGAIGVWRHAVLPFAKRDLLLLGFLTIMTTLLPYWAFINRPDATASVILFERPFTTGQHLMMMTAGSLAGAIPLLGIFFAAKPRE
jgi:multiple sugar transport system permease protein